MIERALKEYLLAQASITALIGSHIYAGRIPQAKTQTIAVLLRRSTNSAVDNIDAESTTTQSTIQVDAYARTLNPEMRAFNAIEAIRLKTSAIGLRGIIGTNHQHRVYGCTSVGRSTPFPVKPDNGSDQWTHRFTMNLLITYKQTTE